MGGAPQEDSVEDLAGVQACRPYRDLVRAAGTLERRQTPQIAAQGADAGAAARGLCAVGGDPGAKAEKQAGRSGKSNEC
jgi:hypothetical protein